MSPPKRYIHVAGGSICIDDAQDVQGILDIIDEGDKFDLEEIKADMHHNSNDAELTGFPHTAVCALLGLVVFDWEEAESLRLQVVEEYIGLRSEAAVYKPRIVSKIDEIVREMLLHKLNKKQEKEAPASGLLSITSSDSDERAFRRKLESFDLLYRYEEFNRYPERVMDHEALRKDNEKLAKIMGDFQDKLTPAHRIFDVIMGRPLPPWLFENISDRISVSNFDDPYLRYSSGMEFEPMQSDANHVDKPNLNNNHHEQTQDPDVTAADDELNIAKFEVASKNTSEHVDDGSDEHDIACDVIDHDQNKQDVNEPIDNKENTEKEDIKEENHPQPAVMQEVKLPKGQKKRQKKAANKAREAQRQAIVEKQNTYSDYLKGYDVPAYRTANALSDGETQSVAATDQTQDEETTSDNIRAGKQKPSSISMPDQRVGLPQHQVKNNNKSKNNSKKQKTQSATTKKQDCAATATTQTVKSISLLLPPDQPTLPPNPHLKTWPSLAKKFTAWKPSSPTTKPSVIAKRPKQKSWPQSERRKKPRFIVWMKWSGRREMLSMLLSVF